jgi:phage terminase large subunit GpA-like protein
MSEFRFYCPASGREIDPGIEQAETIQSAGIRFEALHVRCPHCGEHHEIKIGDALTAAA